jgi:hypothetical protein
MNQLLSKLSGVGIERIDVVVNEAFVTSLLLLTLLVLMLLLALMTLMVVLLLLVVVESHSKLHRCMRP